jgi:malonyl-CoA O-methyltransferase
MSAPADVLAPREAYRLWAPSYEDETAVSWLEDRLVTALTPSVRGLRVLDAGCGTGRRLRLLDDAALAAGVDLTPEMLSSDPARRPPLLAAADVRALPFADASFEVVWHRLVIGHLADVACAYAELARVCRPGGRVIVTDFHPDAARAGHTRSFRGGDGVVHAIEHHVHALEDHLRAASGAGLELVDGLDGEIDQSLRPFYERAGRVDRFERDRGLRIVLALAFRRLPD